LLHVTGSLNIYGIPVQF